MCTDSDRERETAAVQIHVDDRATDGDASALWTVYAGVFSDWSDRQAWQAAVWDKHRGRAGFRLARAYDSDVLIGFAYGYTGEPGQWWTDKARQVLAPAVALDWLGGHFEVVSIAVVDRARGRGAGRALLRRLCEGLPHERWLLMTTADEGDPARRLYASEGWRVIGPGLSEGQVILGKRKG
jgi:GNAT superfamily N-acetyltransferase